MEKKILFLFLLLFLSKSEVYIGEIKKVLMKILEFEHQISQDKNLTFIQKIVNNQTYWDFG